MGQLFDIAELVKVAVEDETTGVVFYSKLAETSQALKDVFTRLAEEEKVHQKRFEQMLTELGGVQTPEQYPGEYTEYLQTLTSGRAFPDEATAMHLAQQCSSDSEALDLASRFERDTLMLMNEMSSLVPEKHREIVKELAKEEQGHLVTLAQAREKLA